MALALAGLRNQATPGQPVRQTLAERPGCRFQRAVGLRELAQLPRAAAAHRRTDGQRTVAHSCVYVSYVGRRGAYMGVMRSHSPRTTINISKTGPDPGF